MAAVQDAFTAPDNATLERIYQMQATGVPISIEGWSLHSQWRFADGSLALDLTLDNGLMAIVDDTVGLWKFLVQPGDLRSITRSSPATITYDVVAVPPAAQPGAAPKVYCPLAGTILIAVGQTRALAR